MYMYHYFKWNIRELHVHNTRKNMVMLLCPILLDIKLTNNDTAEILGLVLTYLHCTPNILP